MCPLQREIDYTGLIDEIGGGTISDNGFAVNMISIVFSSLMKKCFRRECLDHER